MAADMPPHRHPPHPPHHKHHDRQRSAPLPPRLVDLLDARLAAVIPDRHDRVFALRCVLEEGPAHHRGANAALLLLMVEAACAAGGPWPVSAEAESPRMHLPPHLMEDQPSARYPVGMPRAALAAVTGDDALTDELVGALLDGPPQHSVANALMVALLDGILTRAPGRAP